MNKIKLESIDSARKKAMEHIDKISVPRPKVLSEFRAFLDEYKVTGLAIAFIIGAAATTLVRSLADNIIMPLINPFIPGGNWQNSTLAVGPVNLGWGPFLSSFVNFLIIAFAVFLIAKWVLREEKVSKK